MNTVSNSIIHYAKIEFLILKCNLFEKKILQHFFLPTSFFLYVLFCFTANKMPRIALLSTQREIEENKEYFSCKSSFHKKEFTRALGYYVMNSYMQTA